MTAAILSGLVLGLSAGFMPGPLMTMVIAQTLKHNAREGVKVAFAPLLTDAPIVLFTILVLGRLQNLHPALALISLAGAVFLAWMAWKSWTPAVPSADSAPEEPQSLRVGVIANFLSPNPYMFWCTVGAATLFKAREHSAWAMAAFLAVFYGLLVGGKIVIALLVHASRGFLRGRAYLWTMRGLSALLFVFAVLLLRDAGAHFLAW